MKSRVSSTVTKRASNPRPRKYASASERQAAYRARAPEVCFRAEAKTVETLDRIADTLDQSRSDVLLSMTKFALANHDWARFGLTHKPLPFEYGVNPLKTEILERAKLPNGTLVRLQKRGKVYDVITNSTGITWRYLEKAVSEERARNAFDLYTMQRKENPMKTTRAKRTPTPAQLAARERFAQMARSGAFTKGRKRNPVKGERQFKAGDMVVTDRGEIGRVTTYRRSPDGFSDLYKLVDVQANDPYAQTFLEGGRMVPGSRLKAYKGRKTNPAAKTVRRNPASARKWLVVPKTGKSYIVGSFSSEQAASDYIQSLNAPWNYKVKRAAAERAPRKSNIATAPSTVYQVQYTKDGKAWAVWGTYDSADKAKVIAKGGSESIFPNAWWRVESIKVKA